MKDAQGRDVFIEPPNGPRLPQGARGWNPYQQGPYADPNNRFVRPAGPYGYVFLSLERFAIVGKC
jgi:hypothetical protein